MKRNYFFILYTISRRIFRSRASEKLDFAAELGPFSHLLYKRNFHRMPRDDRRLNVSGASGLCRHPSGSGTHGRERAPSNSALFFFTRFSSSDSLAVRASAGISTNFASFFLYLPSSASLSSHSPPPFLTLFTAPSENTGAAPPFTCAENFRQNQLACSHASVSHSASTPCSSGTDPYTP